MMDIAGTRDAAPQSEHLQNPVLGESVLGDGPPPSGVRFAEELIHAEKLSVCSKLCYGIGGAPNQAATGASSFFLNIYLLDIALITPFQTSLVLFLGKTWGAITDPIAGYFITQSNQTKIGQLMPWLLGSTPFIVVTYFLLWYFPPFPYGRVVWYLTFYCLFQALSTVFQVSYSTLTMFLSLDQKDRDSATAYRMAFEVLGTLVGAAVQGSIVASAHTFHHCHQIDLHHNTSSFPDLSHGRKLYMIAGAIIGGIYLVGITALFFGVKEKIDSCTLKSDQKVPFFKGLRLTVKHGPYVKLTASFLLISTAVQIEQNNFVLFCTHAVNLRSHFQYLVLIILLSTTVSIPFWQWFLIHFGKKSTACGISWIIPFAVMLAIFPNVVLAYVVAVISGLSIAVSLLLPWSMLPDVIDHFQVQNPHSSGHEAIFYSSYVFFTKLSSGIGLGISAASLDFAGFRPGACEQTGSVVIMLKVLISAIPSILILVGLFILAFYPINEKRRREMKRTLAMQRQDHTNIETLPANEELTSF